MNLKNFLLNLKELINKTNESKLTNIKLDDLDIKVDNFINWYGDFWFSPFSDIQSNKIDDLIEKMALWYEFRYPEREIIQIIDNKHDKLNLEKIDSIHLYTFNRFVNTLSNNEKNIFQKFKWPDRLAFYFEGWNYLWLKEDGHVEDATNLFVKRTTIIGNEIKEDDINLVDLMKGKNLIEIKEILKLYINIGSNNLLDIDKTIEKYDGFKYLQDELLNCVMYRIIKRGGKRIGPIRACLFAKEFNRNIDIIMRYIAGLEDSVLNDFIEKYLKDSDRKDSICFNQCDEPSCFLSKKLS